MPWDAVLRQAANPGHEHWDREIKNKIAAYKLSVSPSIPLNSDESAQPAVAATRQLPWIQPQHQPQGPPKRPKVKSLFCVGFNKASGCPKHESERPEQAKHHCSYCEKPGHSASACFSKFPELAPAGSVKGKGKKGRNDKKKNKK